MSTQPDSYDAVIVGAGFAGLYMLHRLRGLGLRVRIFEKGRDLGGTWYWNRYPGARCDIESLQYSYQFSEALQQEWVWQERYASQPEILRYANHVAERFDLRRDIRFDAQVTGARFDEADRRWRLELADGGAAVADFCILATGCLSVPNQPTIAGLDTFEGKIYHTGDWPHEAVDFTGQRVAVIGTGSSAIQSIPVIARQAARLHVLQRTPNYAVPAHNGPLDPARQASVKADYAALRARARLTPPGLDAHFSKTSALAVSAEARRQEYEARWREGGLAFSGAFGDLTLDRAANETVAAFVRDKIREQVSDPNVAERLLPRNTFGGKRLCVEIGYFETFNLSHVTLVDLTETAVEDVTPTGLRLEGQEIAQEIALDSLVLATGFDAMTGALMRIDIQGRDGEPLAERWAEGPSSYLGLAMAGYPNLFTITGPASPSVLTNMLPTIEQHVDWIAACLAHLKTRGLTRIETKADAEAAWMVHNAEMAAKSLRSGTDSWYLGANIEGKPRVFMPYIGGFPAYCQVCDEVVAAGYKGFELS